VTSLTLLVVAISGFLIAGLAATATKVLQDYSRRELEVYCQRRNRLDRFREILDEDEHVLISVNSLQVIGLVLLVMAGALWVYPTGAAASGSGLAQFTATVILVSLASVSVVIWVPWAVERLWAASFLYHFWLPLKLVAMALRPLTVGVELVDAFLRRLADRPHSEEKNGETFEDEIRSIVTEGLHEGLVEEDTIGMIEGVIELGDTDVSDIMTKRSNIDAIDVGLSWPEVLEFVGEVGRTRIPVYERNLDNIVGVLYVKDLLHDLPLNDAGPSKSLRERARDPWFVPTTKRLDDLLQEFQATHNHLALVVDEYRAVAGVVTIEDVLEEIVGEIVDESDKEQADEIQPVDESTSDVLGTAHIDVINERLGLHLPDSEECDTIAGLLIRKMGRIPKADDSMTIDGAQITVVDATRRRVEKLRIKKD
jgi:CBS domain containing-hemolysin-like protein